MAGEGPKFLVGDGATAPGPVEPTTPAAAPASGPTPEQRAAIEDYLAGRPLVAAKCTQCQSTECTPVYMLLVHSLFENQLRFRFKHGSEPVHQRYAPHVTMMCTPCYARADGLRTTADRLKWGLGLGALLCLGYFVGMFTPASSSLIVTLLFSGIAVAVISLVIGYAAATQADKALSLPRMIVGGDVIVRVVSRDRSAIEAFLDKSKLAFLDPSELDRLVKRAGG